jgi:hypothetical protein
MAGLKTTLVALGFCLAAAGAACAQTLTLQGLDPAKTKTLSIADFDAMPQVTLTLSQHGRPRAFQGVSLLALMRQVDGPWGDTLTGKQLNEVLLVTCADGYRVAYSIGEADPGTAKGQVLIVDKANGAPLDAKAGPFQIVVENDLRPARWAHQVQKVQLIALK